MRRPEYVSSAVKYYRKALNGLQTKEDESDLKRTFNRGNYTKGLAFGQEKGFISSDVQGHIGEFVGVIKKENSKCIVLCKNTFKNGDGFKVLRSGKEVGGGTYGGESKSGFILLTRDRLANGDKVFITTDTCLNERLLSERKYLPVIISARFVAGQRAEADINGYKYFSDEVLDTANTSPLTPSDVKKNFLKVDGLPIDVVKFGEVVCDNVFMPASRLNAFRRKVFESFYNEVSKSSNGEVNIPLPEAHEKPCKGEYTAVITTEGKELDSCINIIKPNDYFNYKPQNAECKGERYLYLPPYLSGAEIQKISTYVNEFSGIYTEGYYGIQLSKEWDVPFFAGFGLNVTNTIALSLLGAKYVALSKELTLQESAVLSRKNTFYLSGGDIKVMDLIYCPFEKKCSSCDKRGVYNLTDENNRVFPIRRYRTSECRFEVFNCANLICDEHNFCKIYDCTITDGERLIGAISRGEDIKNIFKNYTRGHSNFRTL
jgi:hypothetical protein